MGNNREERLLMKQRGAGTRQINNLGFDLVLPGQAKTPLKPRKSGRNTKPPHGKVVTQKSSRGTPQPASLAFGPRQHKTQQLPSDPLEIEKGNDVDLLDMDLEATRGTEAIAKKRKYAVNEDSVEAVKRPKPSNDITKIQSVPVERGRRTKPKPATSAGMPTQTGGSKTPGDTLNDELSSLLSLGARPTSADTGEENNEHVQKKSDNVASRPKEAAQGDPKPGQRKRVTKARPKRYVPAVTQGKVGAQTAIETVETPVSPTPPKRRKKRKPIGQGGRRKDQPAAAAEVQQPLLVMVGSIATRDELFKAPSQSHKLDMTFHGKKGTPVKKSFKELQEVDVKEPRPMIEDNQKGAKDRKLVARNPRPRVVTTEHGKIEPPGSSSISTGSVQDKMWESPRAAAVQHIDQPRKPLADVTNNTSGPKVKRAALRSPEHKTSAQGPPKSRDLPPNEPNQDPFYMDALVETFSALPEYKTKVSKPKLTKIKPQSEPQPMLKEMAKGAVNHSEQDQASAPKKKRGRPRKDPTSAVLTATSTAKSQPRKAQSLRHPRKKTVNTIPIMVYHSVPSRDPAEDSDDPLALSPPYPRNKVRDTVGKQSSQPIISSDNKKAASGQAQRLKTRLQDTTRIVDRKAPLEEKVIEAEKEERALEKRLKVLRKEARRRRTS